MVNIYQCPICGWIGLDEIQTAPFNSHEICSCCGTQFGLDVIEARDLKTIREDWLAEGAPWFDSDAEPIDWSLDKAVTQIQSIAGLRIEP